MRTKKDRKRDKKMAFNIVRVNKLKHTSQTSNAENHNFRKNPNIKNVNYAKTAQNVYLVSDANVDLQEQFKLAKQKFNFKHTEGKSVKFYEFLFTASPEFFEGKSKKEINKYFEDNLAILQNNILKVPGSVLSAVIHYDEKTPHCHVVALPLVMDNEKEIKRGKDKGKVIQGEFYSLSHERILGKREQYRNLQNVFNSELKKMGYELERGKKNTGLKHEDLKQYNAKIESFKNERTSHLKLDKELEEFESLSLPQKVLKAPKIVPILLNNIAKFKEHFRAMLHIKKQNKALESQIEHLKNRLDEQAQTKQQIKAEFVEKAQEKVDEISEQFKQKLEQHKITVAKLQHQNSELEKVVEEQKEQIKELEKVEVDFNTVIHIITENEELHEMYVDAKNEFVKKQQNNKKTYNPKYT